MSKEAGCVAEMNCDSLGKEVPVKEIDRELAEMFSSDTGIARASLMNLAIYTESLEGVDQNTEIIQELTRENACRALLIVSQPGRERNVHAWVQAHCNIGSGGVKAICSEQVSFLLCGSTANMVRNIVFAHLDTDLPLTFWWQGEISDVFEEGLYSRIDRLIVDSRSWADPAAQFLRLATAAQNGGANYIMHDLAFTQSNQLREAVAQCFEDPASLAELEGLSQAEICYSGDHHMTAVWVAAWLANRLGTECNPDQSNGDCFVFAGKGSRIGNFKVRLVKDDVSEDVDRVSPPISKLSLRAGKDGAHFEITRTENSHDNAFWSLERSVPGRPDTSDLWPIRSFGDVGLVGEILMRAGRNRIMDEVLPLVRTLLTI